MYIGDYMVCEATRRGVKAASIFTWFQEIGQRPLLIRLRRANLAPAVSARLVIQALIRLDYRYSLLSNAALWLHSLSSGYTGAGPPRAIPVRATICSQLYADAFGIVTGRTLNTATDRYATPADLSCTTVLQDVGGLRWLRLA